MSSTDPKLAALSAKSRQLIESWLAQFDQGWREGSLQERVARILLAVKFGQAIAHNPADKASGMGHQLRKMRGIARVWLLSSSIAQALNYTHQRCRIMLCNRLVGARVVAIGAEATVGDDRGAAEFFVSVEQPNLGEIARRPAGEFLEALELARICSTPAGRISRFRGRLEFDKGARRRTCSIERDIRPADARIQKLRRDEQPLRHRQKRDQSLKQLLECRGERRLRNIRVRSAKLSNSLRVGLQEEGDAHGLLLPYRPASVIMTDGRLTRLPEFLLSRLRSVGDCRGRRESRRAGVVLVARAPT